jgi:hypothetical protein
MQTMTQEWITQLAGSGLAPMAAVSAHLADELATARDGTVVAPWRTSDVIRASGEDAARSCTTC